LRALRREAWSGRIYSTVFYVTVILSLAGCARQNYADRSTLHLPVYPLANQVVAPPAAKRSGSAYRVEVFTTWDSFDRVRDWYATMLPRGTQSVVNQVRREATYALFDDRRRSVHLEVAGDQVYIYLAGMLTPTRR